MSLLDRFRRDAAAKPQVNSAEAAKGGSGRGHSDGFLAFDELNTALVHPRSHEVFDLMYRTDADVRQVVSLAWNPIVAGTWAVEPYGGEQATPRDTQIADTVRWALWEYMRPNIITHLIEFLPVLFRSGFVPGEVVWGSTECPVEGSPAKIVSPKRIEMRLPRSVYRWEQKGGELFGIFQYVPAGSVFGGKTSSESSSASPPAQGDLALGEERYQDGGGSGHLDGSIFLPMRNLLYYRIGAEGDNWEGQSLLRPAYKHWYLKDKIERLDAVAQEREATGIAIVYPPPGASSQQLDDVEQALRDIGTNDANYLLMPGMRAGTGTPDGQGWLFELAGYDRSGGGRDPQASLQYHTNKIAAAFISEFMRLGHSGAGSRATAEAQADPFMQAIEVLVTLIEGSLNDSIVAPFVAANFKDAKNAPRLKMSLVDSTSLTQLADYVLKLTQVGALLPDQELEDFLRARADLPPANPESVKKRGDDEEQIRRMIVGGDPEQANPDPFGSNDPTNRGQHHGDREGAIGRRSGGGQKARPTGSPSGTAAAGQNSSASRAAGAKKLSVTFLDNAYPDSSYQRPMRDLWAYEPDDQMLAVDLEAIDDEMAGAGSQMLDACKQHVMGLSDDLGSSTGPLRDAIHTTLMKHYASGRAHVCRELGQADPLDGVMLARGGAIDDQGQIERRSDIAARGVHSVMRHHHDLADLHSGDPARSKEAAEKAGLAAAKRVGQGHGTDAFQQGRHDMALAAAPFVLGARYVSILDQNRCEQCMEADDGVVRSLDDPVRLDKRPPNHRCDSTRGGDNMCRCFEVYEPMPGEGQMLDAADVPNIIGKTNWVERAGGLPNFIARIAGDLITERGFDPSRAIAVAVSRCRIWAAGGGNISPKTQAAAAAALAEWEQKKASS